jgi:hypothetical protein
LEELREQLKLTTVNTRYFTRLAVIVAISLFTGCFVRPAVTTISDTPKKPARTDDRIIADMREQGLSKAKPFYLNEISSKAMRSFVRSYWDATDPKWVKYSGGYVVYFLRDSTRYKVYYTTDGDVQCTIRQFTLEDIPPDIRQMVESAYAHYSIFQVNAVTSMEKTRYVVKIEDHDSFKEIKIDDKGMAVMNDFKKSK